MSALRFDNGSVPSPERSAFWRNAFRELFDVESEATPLGGRTLDKTLERHDIGGLAVVALRGNSQQVLVRDWARAKTVHLLLAQTSGAFIETDGTRQALEPGCAYLVNTRGPVLIQTPDRFEHLALFFPLASSDATRSFIARRDASSLRLGGATGATLASSLIALLGNASEIAAAATPMLGRAIVGLFHAALAETLGVRDHSSRRLETYHRERILKHAQAGLGDPDLSIDSIAAAVGLSTRRVHQLFAGSDMTLMRWVWSERLAQCRARLFDAESDKVRIGELAYEWGFSDAAHFSRAFRQRYGTSPSQHLGRNDRSKAVRGRGVSPEAEPVQA